MNEVARKRTIYQDPYNSIKTWEVTELSGGYYLKQFIKGKQFSRGSRTTKKHLKEIGIFEMECIKVIDNWKEGNENMKKTIQSNYFNFTYRYISRQLEGIRRELKKEDDSNKRIALKNKYFDLAIYSTRIFTLRHKTY